MKSLAQLLAITLLPLALLGMRCERPVNPSPVLAAGGSSATGGSPAVAGETSLAGQAGAAGSAGSPATQEELACSNMLKLGCPEASNQAKCSSDMTKRCANPKVKCDTPCLIDAATKSDIQKKCHLACGGL